MLLSCCIHLIGQHSTNVGVCGTQPSSKSYMIVENRKGRVGKALDTLAPLLMNFDDDNVTVCDKDIRTVVSILFRHK